GRAGRQGGRHDRRRRPLRLGFPVRLHPRQTPGRMRAARRHRRGRGDLPCRRAAREGAQGPDLTAEQPAAPGNWQRWRRAFEVYRDRRQLVILAQGFSSGMPFLLSGSVLTYWMATEKVDLTTIGIFGLVGLPYA